LEMDRTYDQYQIKVGSKTILNFNYIIVDKNSGLAAIVDPAWERERITNTFSALDAKPDKILLTHAHHDHVNLVPWLVEACGSQVYMSAKEIAFYGFKCKNLYALEDGEQLTCGQTQITGLLTPGHTAGSMCYLLSESLFTGDTLFIEGCGMCNTFGGSPEQMFASIQQLKKTIEPQVRIYPGHSFGKDPGYTMGDLLQQNVYLQIENKEHFIQFRMRENQQHLFDFK
jgi:hydroxyacylglutathione hydrolase